MGVVKLSEWERAELLARYKGGARVEWLAREYQITRRHVYELIEKDKRNGRAIGA